MKKLILYLCKNQPFIGCTGVRKRPYDSTLDDFCRMHFPQTKYLSRNLDGYFRNYRNDKGCNYNNDDSILLDSHICKSSEEKEFRLKIIENFKSKAAILSFPNGNGPHDSITLVDFYDGEEWEPTIEKNEYGMIEFLRNHTNSPISNDEQHMFQGPYIPPDCRGSDITRTQFQEWIRKPGLLCSHKDHANSYFSDIDQIILNICTGRSVTFEKKHESEMPVDYWPEKLMFRHWKSTDKYVSDKMTRFYVVFYYDNHVDSYIIRKGPFDDETDLRTNYQYHKNQQRFADYIKYNYLD